MDPVAAKQFLISKVIQQAESDDVPLSEIERKMLHFTETNPPFPDIYEINARFERDYNAGKYEDKIAQLLTNARDKDGLNSPGSEHQWQDAIDALKKEDHYILVMVDRAFGRKRSNDEHRTRDSLIYVGVGLGLVLLIVLRMILSR
jgi:hypothetical protein